MKKMKRLLSAALALVLMASVFAGCVDPGKNDPTDDPNSQISGETGTYSVTVKSAGGMKMENVTVYIYRNEELTDMVEFGETDKSGRASFELPKGGKYYIVVDGLPKGYNAEKFYTFNGNAAEITVKSALITDETLSSATSLKVGDVMYDFEVMLPSGEKYKLSEDLKEKDMVLVNFFYTTCGPCVNEFPFMEEAYKMYKDKVGIIAIDSFAADTNETVGVFQQTMGLSFPMADCPETWFGIFGTQGYPTSIVVDRYGVICLIEVGGMTSIRPFTSILITSPARIIIRSC